MDGHFIIPQAWSIADPPSPFPYLLVCTSSTTRQCSFFCAGAASFAALGCPFVTPLVAAPSPSPSSSCTEWTLPPPLGKSASARSAGSPPGDPTTELQRNSSFRLEAVVGGRSSGGRSPSRGPATSIWLAARGVTPIFARARRGARDCGWGSTDPSRGCASTGDFLG